MASSGTVEDSSALWRESEEPVRSTPSKETNGMSTGTLMHPNTTSRQSAPASVGRLILGALLWIWTLSLEGGVILTSGAHAVAWGTNQFYTQLYEPFMRSVVWSAEEKGEGASLYYRRTCQSQDFSASSLDELMLRPEDGMTPRQAGNIVLQHGNAFFPNVLSRETSANLREYIMDRNLKLQKNDPDFIWLIKNNHRWSFKINVDHHPSVRKAMEEMASNDFLRHTLNDVIGFDPAVVEITAITSEYGATDQHFHKDNTCDMTAEHYGRSFASMYSLFIPLQDTTGDMGATDACPGFHICYDDQRLCHDDSAVRMAGNDGENVWKAGTGWLFHMGVDHRGPAHIAEGAPERVMLIISLAQRPQSTNDRRLLTLGTSYSLKMQEHGQTLYDFLPHRQPNIFFKTLTWMGLAKLPGANWAWPYSSLLAQRLMNYQFGYRSDDLEDTLERYGSTSLPYGSSSLFEWIHVLWIRYVLNGPVPKPKEHPNRIFRVGDRVEAPFDDNYFPGIIVQVHEEESDSKASNNETQLASQYSYDIVFDDGDEMNDAPAEDICYRDECGKMWKLYLDDCLGRFASVTLRLWKVSLWVYGFSLVFRLLLRPQGGFPIGSFVRVVLGSVFWVGLVVYALHVVRESTWGQDILTGRIYDLPFVPEPALRSQAKTPMSKGPSIFPQAKDILIATRLDDPSLGGTNRFLDYVHPGNVEWRTKTESWAPYYKDYAGLPPIFRQGLVDGIYPNAKKGEGHVLYQNHLGDWIVLNRHDGLQTIRRRLQEVAEPGRVGGPGTTIKELQSAAKHGPYRKSALAQVHIPRLLKHYEKLVYGEETKPRTLKDKLHPHTTIILEAGETMPSPITLSLFTLPEMPVYFPIGGHRTLPATQWGHSHPLFAVGDHVVALDGFWCQGRVAQVILGDDKNYYYDVAFADFSFGAWLPEGKIRAKTVRSDQIEGGMLQLENDYGERELEPNKYVTSQDYFE